MENALCRPTWGSDDTDAVTGDALAAKELLRHKNIAVTTDKYVKAIPEALLKGIKLLEAAATSDTADGK